MIIPYRVKNPWKRFPYTTIGLITLNVIVYFFTTQNGFSISEHAVTEYAFKLGDTPLFTLFSAMFLHGDFFHLAGNMLFLWVFAPPVEDRLGIPRFLGVYFATGIVGDLLQGLIDILMHGDTVPGIGASGCIMGVMGAYWYLFSWSTVCVFYWFGWFIRGVCEVAAFWVIGLYLLLDVAEGIFFAGSNGVANFAHVGGSVSGALLCLAMGMKRDSEALSKAKASQAEMKDISMLSLPELEEMLKEDPRNSEVIRAMVRPAIALGESKKLHKVFKEAGPELAETDPGIVLQYLLKLQGDHSIYTPRHLMRLAKHAEGAKDPRMAIDIYQMLLTHHPQAVENEMALYRIALFYQEKLQDPVHARAALQELLKRFPFGSLETHARLLMKQLGG